MNPKKLYKVNEGKMLCGVCTGLGRSFDIDPTLVRLAFLLFSAVGGSGIFLYFLAAIIMPGDPQLL